MCVFDFRIEKKFFVTFDSIFSFEFLIRFHRQSFVRVLHAVNQFRIDIYSKSADVRGTDPASDAVCAYRRWIASRHAFCVNDKFTVKLTMPSESNPNKSHSF